MAGIKDVIKTLDDASEVFDKVVTKSQMKIYEEAVTLMKGLEVDGQGKVKQTIANLKLLVSIKSKLAAVSNNKEYLAGVGKFLQYFDALQKEQNAYFSANFPQATLGEQAKKRHEAMKQIAVQNVIDALTGDGLKANVTDKVNDILLRAVTTGAKFSNLQEELRAHLIGVDGGTGALSRYATTYATTAISQFTGQNNKLLTQDLGVKWFMYTGSTKETTREFCEHLVKKRYIHRSEFHKILQGDIDGHQCGIYAKTGLPFGMIEGTNEDNFQVNCGGWNCRHQLVPVSELAVPQELRDKFPDEEPVKAVETKPEPIPESAYKADLDAFTEYLSKHKSGKVEMNVFDMKVAAEAGDQAKLDALIAEAKATIAKNEASIKQKQEKAKLVKAHGELSVLMNKYDGHSVISAADIVKLMKDGTAQEIDNYIKKVENDVTEIMGCINILDPMSAADEIGVEKLKDLNQKIGNFKSAFNSADDSGKLKLVNANLASIDKSTPDGKIMYGAVMEAKAELSQLQVVQDTQKKVDDVKAYSIAHPKSGKIADLVKEAEDAMTIGDYDLANQKANEAQIVIDKNEASTKSKKAKKEAEKAAKSSAVYKWIKPSADDLQNFTADMLKAADESVESKIMSWKGTVPYGYTEQQWLKKKMTYEIGYLEGNKKYPTWKLVQDVYKNELDKIEQKENAENYKKVIKNEIDSMQKMLQAIVYEDKSKLENMYVQIYNKFSLTDEDVTADIDKFKVEYAKLLAKENKKKLDEEKKAEKERDKILAKVLKSSPFNKDLSNDEFILAAQRTYDSGKYIGAISPDKLKEYRENLRSAIVSKDRAAIVDALKNLGYDPENNFGKWRQDSAIWYKDSNAQPKTDAVLRDKASELWLNASDVERDAAWEYTHGSNYLNKPLRGIYYSEWKYAKTKSHCTALTNLISKSVYQFDKWVQRGEDDAVPTNIRFGIDLDSYIPRDANGNPKRGLVQAIVGKKGVEHGFTSTGSAGGKGFSGYVIYNIFCPAGTEALYCEPFSYYGYGVGGRSGMNGDYGRYWNGTDPQKIYGGEFETLIQRETEYVITKAEYVPSGYSGQWYIDVMVVSQKHKKVDLSPYIP